MRNMSFALTTPQILRREKTVTRRLGWESLTPGQQLCAVKKGMGLKPGEAIERLAVLIVVSIRREPLRTMLYHEDYGRAEVVKEGFPDLTPAQFVGMFCEHMRCEMDRQITRVEFDYVEGTP